MKLIRGVALASLASITLFGSGLGASAETMLRFAHTLAPSDTQHAAALAFKERVESLTNGSVRVSVHPGGELGNDSSILEGVRLGTIDIAITGNPFFTRFEPKLNVLDLPYLFSSYEHVYSVLDGAVGAELLAGLEKHRMKPLAFWEIGFRNLTNSKRPITKPEDLAGLKIRTTPNPAHVQAFRLLGAIPTPMPFTEVYLALETGAVDGQENPLPMIYANHLHEVQKHLTLTRHAYTPSIVVMSQAKWGRLSDAEKKAVLEAANDAKLAQRKLNREEDAKALAGIRAAGVNIVETPDIKPFETIVRDVGKATYAKEHGSALLDAITSQEK